MNKLTFAKMILGVTFFCFTPSAFASTPDSILIDSIQARPVELVDIHVRQQCDEWSLVWDYTDPMNYNRATVRGEKTYAEDIDFGLSSIVTVETVRDGQVTQTYDQKVRHTDTSFSLRLTADRFGERLYAGDGEQLQADFLAIQPSTPSKIILITQTNAKDRRVSHQIKYQPKPRRARFATLDELDTYLLTTSDLNETYWQYLDRDIDAQRAQLGGFYKLATVRSGDGYDIIYIDGASAYADRWQPLDIKGHLKKTIFINSYDLEWIDSAHRAHSIDVSATITDASILTLSFPLLKSQLRLSRMVR